MAAASIDYAALAKQAGAVSSQPAAQPAAIDYAALARQAGAVQSVPAAGGGTTAAAAVAGNDGPHWYDAARKELGDLNAGFTTGLSQTGHTAERVLSHVPGIGTSAGFQRSMAEDQARANAPLDSGGKIAGNVIENILEFAAGDEAVKGLALGDKVAHLGKIAGTLEKYPAIAKLLGKGAEGAGKVVDAVAGSPTLTTGVQQAAVGTAQGLAHGESLPHAAATGALAGAGGVVLEGGMRGAGKIIDAVRPGERVIGGRAIPELASQRPGAGQAALRAAEGPNTQGILDAQQAGAQGVHQDIAQKAVRDSLDRLNATRPQPISDPARMLPAPADAQPYQFQVDGPPPTETLPRPNQTGTDVYAGQRQVPNPEYTSPLEPSVRRAQGQVGSAADATPERSFTGSPTRSESQFQHIPPPAGSAGNVTRGGGGTILTTDSSLVHSQLSHLETLMDTEGFDRLPQGQQEYIQSAAENLRKQVDQYGAYQARMSHFPQVDSALASSHVANYGHGADMLEGYVKPVFAAMDQASPKFAALREAEKATLKVQANPSSTESWEKAGERLADIRSQIDDIFTANPGKISPAELTAARSTYRDASTLRDIHASIERSYNGISAEDAARSIQAGRAIPRIQKGGEATNKTIERLLNGPRGADVRRVIGGRGVDNLYQVSDMLKTTESAQAAHGLYRAASNSLRRHGHTIGSLVGTTVGGSVGFGAGGPFGAAGGAAAGAAVGASTEAGMRIAYRKVMHAVATNPDLAARAAYAVSNRVIPRQAGPLLAAMMLKFRTDDEESK